MRLVVVCGQVAQHRRLEPGLDRGDVAGGRDGDAGGGQRVGDLAANYYRDRSRKPQTPIDDAGVLSAPHTTEDLVEDRDDLARILAGVQQLPDDRREALIMRFALGMDNREIARAMGRSDGATKVLIHRAIKQLEELMDDE